ncbi:MAG: NAD(P) transhydrogenase subunit alpha [Holosporales bacterium]|jgi:NAD(P) transhydrogenase subunit alpha|nr:NAD(P) transhydrogenase subunit alpha [Holosporales bacterium]
MYHVQSVFHKIVDISGELSDAAAMLTTIDLAPIGGCSQFMWGVTVFVLACFVGYYVVWRVTPALHAPLMAVTNAISSVIIVGAILAAGQAESAFAKIVGFSATVLVSVNIFGGFLVTKRMLAMFQKKDKQEGRG